MKRHKNVVLYFAQNVYILVGLVLVWRGMWYALDALDKYLLGNSHILTSLGGILLGMMILYLPDHDLNEIQKL